jgi:hypothetical protein
VHVAYMGENFVQGELDGNNHMTDLASMER